MKVYNFFNYIKLSIHTKNYRYKKYFDNEYKLIDSNTSTRKDINLSIDVFIVKQLPEPNEKTIIHERLFKKIFRFKYTITNLESNNTIVHIEDHIAAKVYAKILTLFLQTHVIEPVMYFKLINSNILFMHAAGVSKSNEGYIFPAYGGTGKTTLSINLLNHGFDFMGDDLLFVDPSIGRVYPYQRPLHLFSYNADTIKTLPIILKFKIYLKNIIRFLLEKILRTEFLISTRVHAHSIVPGLTYSDPVTYSKILFLKKKGTDKKYPLVKKVNIEKHAKKIILSSDLNDSLFTNVLDNRSMIKQFKNKEMEVVCAVLSRVKSIEYINTRNMNMNSLDNFVSKLINEK